MSSYLESIHQRLVTQAPIVLVYELELAFREARSADPHWATPRLNELHDLLRFCKFDAIAPWLANDFEREALVATLVLMAAQYGEAARELLARYAQHNDATLFQHGDSCGFYIAAVEDWDELRARDQLRRLCALSSGWRGALRGALSA